MDFIADIAMYTQEIFYYIIALFDNDDDDDFPPNAHASTWQLQAPNPA